MGENEQQQWYTNRDLFEMVQGLVGDIAELRATIQKTETLLRDYNGLRERLNTCERSLSELDGKGAGGKDTWGYVAGAIGLLLAVWSFVK